MARLFLVAFAALQLVEPAAAQWADARLEADSRASGLATHIEDRATARCAPIHLPDCTLCRFLAQPGLASHSHVFIASRILVRARTAHPAISRVGRRASLHPPSRAPPLVVRRTLGAAPRDPSRS
ncbi:MAG TPA: hypothetical protein VMH88_13665 [Gemmatimonadales bacterium]|nr:hypothetical protein [Gemmatimonadales bacterium]